ncbi:ECF transporter S component [Solibacillus sp. MA9]|uniref:ECF transporter S component n=1 Tax=Solibacillus palustris TaxID=2908203 RepID=A0ABS9UAG5_9BACL|nr:ECF transporter S component [Solibacillus sp. MA9]MCH7321120.1 ECF transporter S component [Solibacillus sp. MA9]
MEKNKLRLIILTALIAAICVIGSMIKVPVGMITTAALDSAPAFISAVFLPPVFAGAAGAFGHIATGLTSGFPLGVFHVLIAIEMFVVVAVFAWLHRKGYHFLKWVFAIVANGIISPLPFYFLISPAFYIGALPSLFIATVINVAIAAVVMPVLKTVIHRVGVNA